MADHYTYAIIGGGLAGASAIDGIRACDTSGSIALICQEDALPYNRPPLSKGLWTGKKNIDDIFVQAENWYQLNGVTLKTGTTATRIDPENKIIDIDKGEQLGFDKLLIATGGIPKRLSIPGGDLEIIYYYRYLNDYRNLRNSLHAGMRALVIGGGFIGSEIAASLRMNSADVCMVFPDEYLCARVFPKDLGNAITQAYGEKGIAIISGDIPASIERRNSRYVVLTKKGREIETDIIIAGLGITPETELARNAGLATANGILVNEQLKTSHSGIYVAGDNANFVYMALDRRMRVEHWDNALNQGLQAGRNMAGASEPYTYMPYFFSDLFEFGYEAVGDVNSELETVADWKEENKTGIIYYLDHRRIRGIMLCNVWDKVPLARPLIGEKVELSRTSRKMPIPLS